MQLSSAITSRFVRGSAGATSRPYSLPAVSKIGRKPCKPVCFKENNPDRIDDATTGKPPTTAGGPSTTPTTYGTEPVVSTAGLRSVNLGPVASVMYPVLMYGTFAAAAAAIAMPGTLGSFLFRGAAMTTTHKILIMSAGAALIPSVIALRQTQRAADAGILASPSFKQMVSSSLLHGVLGLVVLSQAVSLRNPILGACVGGLTGLATITTSYTLMKIRESGQLAPSVRGMLGGVLSLLTPANMTAAAYSVLTVAMAAAGATLFTVDPAAPCFMFFEPKDAVHVFATRMTGASMLANAVLLFTVKQAADDGRQGSPIFRNLNGAIATFAGATAAVLAYALTIGVARPETATWSFVGAMAVTALVTGYNYATAPSERTR